MKLANQIVFLGATSVSILFGVVSIILYIGFPDEQEKLLTQGGSALAENLRLRINPMILTDDMLSLNDALVTTMRSDKNIVYIFVLNKKGLPLASTFSKGVPKDLLNIVSQKTVEKKVQFISQDIGTCINISTFLMEGDLGSLHLGLNSDPINVFAYKSIVNLSVTFIVISVISIWVAFLIGRGIGKPLEQITNAIKKSEGRWPKLDHIDTGTTDEIQEFATMLKQIIIELEDAERIRRSYEQKLLATERLASVGELASEVAHEINNPLDGLIEITRYLEKNNDDSQKIKKYMPLIKEGLERIEKTGRQLLDFSRSEGADFNEIFDLNKVINDINTLLEGSMDQRNISVSILCHGEFHAIGNAIAVGQAIMNLLLNAADALLPQGGKIIIRVLSKHSNIITTITDNGSGISDEIRENIFEPFFSTKKAKGGNGLGLAVSRRLIQKCDGDLFLDKNRSLKDGTTFVLKLIDANKSEKNNAI